MYQYLQITKTNNIATVELNRPKKMNAMNEDMWFEIGEAFKELDKDNDVKVCLLKGKGKHFSSGIDLSFVESIMEKTKEQTGDEAQRQHLKAQILKMQDSFNALEDCQKPIIALIHGACIGGAIDLIAACDIRLSTYHSAFSIMETKLGIVADMGTLQRLPYILNDGDLKELALTSKLFSGYKAKKLGLVGHNYLTVASLEKAGLKLAQSIATLPDIAVQGTKKTLNSNRRSQVHQGLEYIANLNADLLRNEVTVKSIAKIKAALKKK
jgi:enoyl-CoA hydratase